MEFIAHLMRKGPYGHYWSKTTKLSEWWKTLEGVPEIPEETRLKQELYFGVHPSKEEKGQHQRSREEDIAAVSCVYADIDAKDFGNSKRVAENHIKELNPPPSIIVDSGGGFHCYWLLEEPFEITTKFKLEVAKSLQARWVDYVGGDLAVHDLARILRIPGTLNHKYDPPREVKIVYQNLDRLYTPDSLEEFLPDLDHRGGGEEELDELNIPAPARPNSLTAKQIVKLARGAADGEKFEKLWKGWSENYPSESEADLALCCMLAFWTGGDYEKIDYLFRASKRYREKWEREDYRYNTIIKALAKVKDFYVDPGGFLVTRADDYGNAMCVNARTRNSIAYTDALGWMTYQDNHWDTECSEAEVTRKIISVLKKRRVAAVNATGIDEKYREAVIRCTKTSSRNVANCRQLLKAVSSVHIAGFDEGNDFLNCQNGVVDLRTGQILDHSPERKFTYCLPVDYDENADYSFWEQWLLDTVGGRQEVLDFLQLAVGYSITGHTHEEVMFYIEGPPRSGKGTFTETLMTMLGGIPLATEVGMEAFMESGLRSSSQQGFLLAYMRACRFVAASESKESHWLDTALIKRWTGGNAITCAHKYGHPFTYVPRFKIWLSSNYPLQMDAEDVAGWSRVNLIKFPNSHLGIEDKMLKTRMRKPEVLKTVLAWAVEGAIKWREAEKDGGLRAPDTIKAETEAARENLDWVAQWVYEQIIITGDDGDFLSNSEYYQEYRDWCIENGVSAKKLISLNRTLSRKGYSVGERSRVNGRLARGWRGVRFHTAPLRVQLGEMKDACSTD